jgi:hypothetical protein
MTVLDAACASIASHDRFNAVAVGEGYSEVELRSGLMGYPNPTSELLKEAAREFGEDRWAATVISIGAKSIPPSSGATDAQRIEAILKDTDAVHQKIHRRLHQFYIYFRFDMPHQKSTISDTRRVYREIQGYTSDGKFDKLMDQAVRSIHLRQQVITLSGLSEYYSHPQVPSNFSFGKNKAAPRPSLLSRLLSDPQRFRSDSQRLPFLLRGPPNIYLTSFVSFVSGRSFS